MADLFLVEGLEWVFLMRPWAMLVDGRGRFWEGDEAITTSEPK